MNFLFYCVLILLLAFQSVKAAEFDDWVPTGWKLHSANKGDINRDGAEDVALVLEQNDPVKIKPNSALGAEKLNLNPRRLLVLFKSKSGYEQILTKDDYIPSQHNEEQPCLEDPVTEDSIKIKNGILSVKFHKWLSCGGWGESTDEQKFRYMAEKFRLIGIEHSEFKRNSGEKFEHSINFLTGKVKTIVGLNEFQSTKPKLIWSKLANKNFYYLDGALPICNFQENVGKLNCN